MRSILDLVAWPVVRDPAAHAKTSQNHFCANCVCDIVAAKAVSRSAKGNRPKRPVRTFQAVCIHLHSPIRKGTVPTIPTSKSK
jgi:hypothetical protein